MRHRDYSDLILYAVREREGRWPVPIGGSESLPRQSLITASLLFPDVAEDAWARCSNFKLVDVAGEPLLGEVSLP